MRVPARRATVAAPQPAAPRERLVNRTLNACAAALACVLLGSGCAPDAWTNVKAQGFNAFLDQAAAQCQPLYAGPLLITRGFRDPAWDLNSYDYYDQWLDQTSRLYYRKISPQTYLENVNNLFGARSAESARCVVQQLPADAPPPPRLQ